MSKRYIQALEQHLLPSRWRIFPWRTSSETMLHCILYLLQQQLNFAVEYYRFWTGLAQSRSFIKKLFDFAESQDTRQATDFLVFHRSRLYMRQVQVCRTAAPLQRTIRTTRATATLTKLCHTSSCKLCQDNMPCGESDIHVINEYTMRLLCVDCSSQYGNQYRDEHGVCVPTGTCMLGSSLFQQPQAPWPVCLVTSWLCHLEGSSSVATSQQRDWAEEGRCSTSQSLHKHTGTHTYEQT